MLSLILAPLLPNFLPEYADNLILNSLPGKNLILAIFVVVIIDSSRFFFFSYKACFDICVIYRTALSSHCILNQVTQVTIFFFSLLLELHGDSTETVSSTEARSTLEGQPEKSER